MLKAAVLQVFKATCGLVFRDNGQSPADLLRDKSECAVQSGSQLVCEERVNESLIFVQVCVCVGVVVASGDEYG